MISAFFTYQLKVAVILASFYLLYVILMRRETLHRLNRAVLLSSLALSLILPFCKITIHREISSAPVTVQSQEPSRETAQQKVSVQPIPAQITETAEITPVTGNVTNTAYADAGTEAINDSPVQTPAIKASTVSETPAIINMPREINWQLVLFIIWILVTAVCIIRLAISVLSISSMIRKGRTACIRDGVRIVVTHAGINPFSWMNNIVLSIDDYNSVNADAIIEHELSHVRNRHSWDILAIDIFAAVQWFNPAIYELRKSLQEVHEYQADNSVISHGYNTKSYQMMLIGKLALENGYNIANNFSKKNISNRISMMNKKNSPFVKAWKALFVPALTAVFLAFTAVIIYDCTPASDSVTEVKMDPEFKALQEHYGQGAFVAAHYKPCNIWLNKNYKDARIEFNGGEVQDILIDSIPAFLASQENTNKIRVNICLEDWRKVYSSNNRSIEGTLKIVKPLLKRLEGMGIRSLVLPYQTMLDEVYYSTYKYARIYETPIRGRYELVHNSLSVTGRLNDIKEWITLLDIQYVAFYTMNRMPISDVASIMDVAKSRGVMTFIACRPENKISVFDMKSSIKSIFPYKATILPVKRNLNSEFAGKSLIETAEALEYEYTDAYLSKAKKVIENPISYSQDTWFRNSKILLCDDELIIILNPYTMSRNSWVRPDFNMFIRVDGKDYRLTAKEGYQDFADYPWITADNYANGSLCWGPDYSTMYTTLHFEPIPMDSKSMDILGNDCAEYWARGILLKDPKDSDHRLQPPYCDIISLSTVGNVKLEGVPGNGSVYVSNVEFLPDKTNLLLNLRLEAPFSYPGYLGSDITLKVEKTGQEYKPTDVSGAVFDQDFDRGGDHITTNIILSFPKIQYSDIVSDMSQADINKRTPTPGGGNEMKTMTLEGTICHQKISIPIIVPRPLNQMQPK